MASVDDDEDDEEQEEAWFIKVRPTVLNYLASQNVLHRRVGDVPAWHIVPYVSVWAVEGLAVPGSVGWWVFYGDLPTDYCSSDDCRHPRLALRRIAASWVEALEAYKPGDKTIGSTGISIDYADLLSRRAGLLLRFADDAGLWPDDIYG